MPIRAEEFYQAAQHLNRLKPPLVSDEVCARTMINRMYYAAYLAAREAIRAHLGNPRFDVSHRALAETLAASTDAEVQELGLRLWALKTARELADYDPRIRISRASTAVRLLDARDVLDNVSRLARRFPPLRRR